MMPNQVGAIYNGSNLFSVFNGVISSTSTVIPGKAQHNTNQVKLCRSDAWGSYAYAVVDEVRIYNRSLTSAEIASAYNRDLQIEGLASFQRAMSDQITINSYQPPTDSLAAYYPFDNDNNVSSFDASGYSNTAAYNGSYTITGIRNQGSYYNGKNNSILAPDANQIDMNNFTSISVWFKPDKLINPRVSLVSKHYTEYEIDANPSGCIHTYSGNGLGGYDEGITKCIAAGNWNAGVWHHVVWTLNMTEEKLYIDGIYLGNYFKGHNGTRPGTHTLAIGRRGDPNADLYFNGTIDEVRIYNRTLTQAEAYAIFKQDYQVLSEEYDGFRTESDTLDFEDAANRQASLDKDINVSLNINNNVNRKASFFKVITQEFSFNTLTYRIAMLLRIFSDWFSFFDDIFAGYEAAPPVSGPGAPGNPQVGHIIQYPNNSNPYHLNETESYKAPGSEQDLFYTYLMYGAIVATTAMGIGAVTIGYVMYRKKKKNTSTKWRG